MIFLYVPTAIIICIFVIVIAVSVYFFNFAIRAKRPTAEQALEKARKNPTYNKFYDRIYEGYSWMTEYPHERVQIKSYDGLTLYASVYEPKIETKSCMILFHGWTSHPFLDFSCIVEKYCEMDMNVIVVEQRGHGESEGKYSTFGVKERYDVVSWAEYVISRYGDECKIVLDGISMGASTVMMATGLDCLPKNIVGVIADCGFTSAYDQFVYIMKLWYKMPPFPLLYSVNLISKIFAGFGFRDVSTIEELKKSTLPILFLHGEADDFVPDKFSRQNYEASASMHKKLITVPDAAHGMSYLQNEKTCNEELESFIYSVI